jgi:hypothetical protein
MSKPKPKSTTLTKVNLHHSRLDYLQKTLDTGRCPKCGHKDSFVIEASECLLFHAEGSAMPGDCGMEWGERSYCRCPECDHAGTVRDFHPEAQTAVKKELYYVGIREVHVRHFNVMASGAEEAKDLVASNAPEAVDLEDLEYSNELGKDTWDAHVIPEQPMPDAPAKQQP